MTDLPSTPGTANVLPLVPRPAAKVLPMYKTYGFASERPIAESDAGCRVGSPILPSVPIRFTTIYRGLPGASMSARNDNAASNVINHSGSGAGFFAHTDRTGGADAFYFDHEGSQTEPCVALKPARTVRPAMITTTDVLATAGDAA